MESISGFLQAAWSLVTSTPLPKGDSQVVDNGKAKVEEVQGRMDEIKIELEEEQQKLYEEIDQEYEDCIELIKLGKIEAAKNSYGQQARLKKQLEGYIQRYGYVQNLEMMLKRSAMDVKIFKTMKKQSTAMKETLGKFDDTDKLDKTLDKFEEQRDKVEDIANQLNGIFEFDNTKIDGDLVEREFNTLVIAYKDVPPEKKVENIKIPTNDLKKSVKTVPVTTKTKRETS